MEERPAAGSDEDAVVVQVTPSDYRFRAVLFVLGGLAVAAVGLLLSAPDHRGPNPLFGAFLVGYGVYCASRHRRQVTETVLRIDRTGLRSDDGLVDRDWSGVTMVWVGSSTGLRLPFVAQPVLSLFTRAGMDFAERAGTRLQPVQNIPFPGPLRTAGLCERLSRITGATVVDGSRVSRRRAAAELVQRTQV